MDSALSPQDSLSVHGDIYDGRENEEADDTARTGGGNLVGQWIHQSDSGSQMSLQSYYDRTHLADPIPEATIADIPIAPAGFLKDDLTTLDMDFQDQLQTACGASRDLGSGLSIHARRGAERSGSRLLPDNTEPGSVQCVRAG